MRMYAGFPGLKGLYGLDGLKGQKGFQGKPGMHIIISYIMKVEPEISLKVQCVGFRVKNGIESWQK